MKLNIFGLGYVGSVTGLCLASIGHEVTGVEVVDSKVDAFNRGELPIFEPGLEELCQEVMQGKTQGRFKAVTDLNNDERSSSVSIICVGTPSQNFGGVDLSQIKETMTALAKRISKNSESHHVIVRSTIPPGTTQNILIPLLEEQSGKKCGKDFSVCFYPEFLREGQAIGDFFKPSLNIVGSDNEKSLNLIQEIFKVDRPPARASIKTAEMIKYANNSFHAIKVAFANEMGSLAQACQVDSQELMKHFVTDGTLNLSPYYLRPGFAFGGACLPKELRAISSLAQKKNLNLPLLSSIMPSNEEHIHRFLNLVEELRSEKIGFCGITFKPNTDDVRGSPLVTAIETLFKIPSYKTTPQIFIYDQAAVLEKTEDLFKDPVKGLHHFNELVQSCETIVLGPFKLTEQQLSSLNDFKGTIIDLKWHSVPEKLKAHLGYRSIC